MNSALDLKRKVFMFHVSCCYVKKKNGAIEIVTNVSCVYCLLENFAAASCAIGRE